MIQWKDLCYKIKLTKGESNCPPIMPVQLLHFFDSDFSKGGGYSACSRVFSWVFLSGKISAIGLFVLVLPFVGDVYRGRGHYVFFSTSRMC